MTLVPAYGRDYKSAKEVKLAWESGKDFTICDISAGRDDGRYINRSDALAGGVKRVNIRYKKLTQVTVIEVK